MPIDPPHILIVDDRKENLIALEALLEACDAVVQSASSGNEALAWLLEREFALVLLDVQMPNMDGFEVAELMRSNPLTQLTPIIFVTAINKEQQHIFKGYEAGAVDYLSKPIDPTILCSKVKIFLELWRQRQQLARAVADLEAANQKILMQQEELRELSIHDHLTGLYQRRWFDEMVDKEVAKAVRQNIPLSIAMIDVDHFKPINDNYGHSAGDAILVQLAKVLEDAVRKDDMVIRYGGEEFVVLMPHADRASATVVCERIRSRVAATPFRYNSRQHQVTITISVGVAELLELGAETAKALIEQADSLLYQAKAQGRDRVCHEMNSHESH